MDAREAFDKHDEDGNGQIDLMEFRKIVAELGLDLDAAGAEAAFDEIDNDETGLVDFDEFKAWWDAR